MSWSTPWSTTLEPILLSSFPLTCFGLRTAPLPRTRCSPRATAIRRGSLGNMGSRIHGAPGWAVARYESDRGWGDRQPDRFRRAVTAGVLEGGLVALVGLFGEWRWAGSWRPLPRRWLWPTHSQKEGGHPGSWPSIPKNRGRSHLDLRTRGSTLCWQHSHASHRPTADRYSPSPRSVGIGSSANGLPLHRDSRPGCLGGSGIASGGAGE